MKISVLTTITNPDDRQDKWIEAMQCYLDLADELVVVNGGTPATEELKKNLLPKVKLVELPWPHAWNWIELPRHLNVGLQACTGDWVIKLDVDQFFHEDDIPKVREELAKVPSNYIAVTFQKMSMAYEKKYYQKGGQPIAFRKYPSIAIGKNLDRATDLCYPVQQTGVQVLYETMINTQGQEIETNYKYYELPIGHDVKTGKIGLHFWNYDYFFKTQDFTRKEFWRFSQAYHRYFKSWQFGDSEEAAFQVFLNMLKGRYNRSPYEYTLEEHPKYIRKAVEELKPEQFGFNAWGLL